MNAKEASKLSDVSMYTEKIFNTIQTHASNGYRECIYCIYKEAKITDDSVRNIVQHLHLLGYYVTYEFKTGYCEIKIKWD